MGKGIPTTAASNISGSIPSLRQTGVFAISAKSSAHVTIILLVAVAIQAEAGIGDFVSARRTLGLAFLGAGTALAVKGFDYREEADAFYADYQRAVDPIEINRLYQRTTNRDIKAQVSWALAAACGVGGLRLLATGDGDRVERPGESEASPEVDPSRNPDTPKPRLLLKPRLDPSRRHFGLEISGLFF